MNNREEKLQAIIEEALNTYSDRSSRSMQSQAGILGPSDIGFCRQKAVLMTKGIKQSDSPVMWSAAVGTSIHNYVEAALKAMHPDWIMGSVDNLVITATLPSGVEISGHPDIVVPASNAILDIKTVNGLEWVKRHGTSDQHKYQRHLYAMGLISAGILDADKPVMVGNVYFDRSGSVATPYVTMEVMDENLTAEIDSWIQDVIYAVEHNEDSSRDVTSVVCAKICSYFTACRGALENHSEPTIIDYPEHLNAISMYAEALDLGRQSDRMKQEAKEVLAGVNGSTGKYDVRWVTVNGSNTRAGYERFDLVPTKATSDNLN